MNNQSETNKKAWEYRAYEHWCRSCGSPAEKARLIYKNPKTALHNHYKYFENIEYKKIANLCGSNGRKAVPLALLGADVTVFDISEENKKYALELANEASVTIDYVVCDLYEIDLNVYGETFDMLYLEGGILHYFNDLNKLFNVLFALLKTSGQMVLSDFHPFRKCNPDTLNAYQTHGNYFDNEMHTGDVAYKSFFNESEQSAFPDCLLRFYTLGEIVTAAAHSGFRIISLEETPRYDNPNLPGEFTILAEKI